MAARMKDKKKQHILVFTRVRPLSTQELRSQVVVECLGSKEVSVRDKSQTKTFTFDQVFGPNSKQVDVYKAVVHPLIAEVLQGYSCTVFAYGQTGTGKTYTMVGEKSKDTFRSWEDEPSSGIIPRTLSHLFDELNLRAEEFTVKVSFLELYNEELCDLLAPNDHDDGKNLKLFEDSTKKGSVIVNGLEERIVHNKDDVYAILEAGNLRRQTASTFMNAQSSRSHTIFTITVHIKVTTPEGEDLMKTGKLNLVDLAGSENIGRSGAVDMRAREAGNINQSLLTLGRVITSLVERAPHVPYRESKLTRILQDSLGGRTKTSIIATVSPALCNIEETLSTFDYAHRARNITIKPEINQKTSKRVLIKEYTEKIERLQRDLTAAREKNGVYLAHDNYNEMMAEKENLKRELVAKLNLLKVTEEEFTKQEENLRSLNMNLFTTQSELAERSQQLKDNKKLVQEMQDMLDELSKETSILLKTTDEAVNDAKKLHDRHDRSQMIQEHNTNLTEKFKNNYCGKLNDMKTSTNKFNSSGISLVEGQIEAILNLMNYYIPHQNGIKDNWVEFCDNMSKNWNWLKNVNVCQVDSTMAILEKQREISTRSLEQENEMAQDLQKQESVRSVQMKEHTNQLRDKVYQNERLLDNLRTNIQEVENKNQEINESRTRARTIISEEVGELKNKILGRLNEKINTVVEECENLKLEAERGLNEIFDGVLRNCESVAAVDRNFTSETTKLTSQMVAATGFGMNDAKTTVTLINTMDSCQEDNSSKLLSTINESLKTKIKNYENMTKEVESQSQELNQCLEQVKIRSKEAEYSLEVYDTNFKEKVCSQMKLLSTSLSESLAAHQNLASEIRGHSEELFSNLHDRMKEIEVFFAEEIKKDEKTGYTPQRREFNYPKRLVSFTSSRKNSNRLENDISNQSWDLQELSDEKENIGHLNPGTRKPLSLQNELLSSDKTATEDLMPSTVST